MSSGAAFSERVATDVAAEDGLALAYGALDGVEARAMGAARTQHRWARRQLGFGDGFSVMCQGVRPLGTLACVEGPRCLISVDKLRKRVANGLDTLLARVPEVAVELAVNGAR